MPTSPFERPVGDSSLDGRSVEDCKRRPGIHELDPTGAFVGYARCSTEDLTARRRLRELGVAEDRIYLDHGFTGNGSGAARSGSGIAAVRRGDTGGHTITDPAELFGISPPTRYRNNAKEEVS